jgi:hypothetical protein
MKLQQVGVIGHIYIEEYCDASGVEFLLDKNIPVYKLISRRIDPLHPDILLPRLFQAGYWWGFNALDAGA